MKVVAIADNIESLEKLINEYFYSIGYEIIVMNRYDRYEGNEKIKLEFRLENKRFNIDYMKEKNKDYCVKYKKGKYYFYKVVSDEEKNI